MCGIAGIVSPHRADADTVRAMASVLRHRGPDDEGYVAVDSDGGVVVFAGDDTAVGCIGGELPFSPTSKESPPGPFDVVLGARRLAILDLSPHGHQPMCSSDGRVWIVHNGEIYNYVELRRELEAQGHRFIGASDTEVALHAYLEWGERCFARFNGMWGMAIWDGRQRRLVLSRDRLGVKPLYYAEVPGGLAFASEIKALLAAGLVARSPNPAALEIFLATGRLDVLPGQTCFGDVKQVEPGSYLEHTAAGERRISRFWRAAPGDSSVSLRELLDDAVRLRLRSDVPVGSCLSGGLDSSSIVALVQAQLGRSDGRLATFTYASPDPAQNELHFARTVAAATGADGHVVGDPPEVLPDVIADVIREQDEPIGSGSVVAQRQVMRCAREHGVTVLLDGQGGDEVLAGYKYYLAARLADIVAAGRLGRWAGELAACERNGLVDRRWLVRATLGELRRRPLARERLRARQLEDVLEHLPALLHYEDRNSMAFSIETRLPFLDYRVVELGLALAGEAKISDGWTKLALRRAMEGSLPDNVVWRRDKVQFTAPQAAWLGGPLREVASDLFASSRFGDRAGGTAAELRKGLEDQRLLAQQADVLWRHLAVELWHEVVVDAPRHARPLRPMVVTGS